MMVLPLLFLIGVHDWVPARWGSGDPKTLDILRGGTVNCLLLEAENWNGKFVESAGSRHLAILGNGIVMEGDFDRTVANAVRTEAGKLTVIELPSRGRMRLDSDDPVIGASQALWPGIEIQHGGTVSTGPTSAPWINTNTGFLRFVGPRRSRRCGSASLRRRIRFSPPIATPLQLPAYTF
jgi:hypothetical protein